MNPLMNFLGGNQNGQNGGNAKKKLNLPRK